MPQGKSQSNAGRARQMIRRTRFLMIVCGIVVFLCLAYRLWQLQIRDHNRYETAAVDQMLSEETEQARRGTIYDRDLNVLAISSDVSTVYISPAEIELYGESPQLIAAFVSETFPDVSYAQVLEWCQNTDSWHTVVATKVDREVSAVVQAFIDDNNLNGLRLEASSQRHYPYGTLACHVVGYVGSDGYGLAGVEYAYDDELSGTDGRIIRAETLTGDELLFSDFADSYEAVDGSGIVLTIDTTIQYYLEKYLTQACEDYELANGAAGIVMDVNTGEILAMASLDNFDPNDFLALSEDIQAEIDAEPDPDKQNEMTVDARNTQWRNKAIADSYEPGSTFKIITLAMALEDGVVSMDSTFECWGSVSVRGRTSLLNCWETLGHGVETLTQAVMNSCNVAFVRIGQAVGAERFYDYVDAFGLFERTGIELAGESGSVWWSEDVFFDEDNQSQLAAASFGQTFTITPLQLITAVSAVANGGYLMQPHIVRQILDADGNVLSQTEPVVVRQVISEQTSALCCNILEQVVGDPAGTGTNAYVAGYRICGKTGTSENVTLEAETGEKEYIVSFIGFAPADDPQVAVLVMLDTPKTSSVYISGGQMAAPLVGSIMADILPYLGVEVSYTDREQSVIDRAVPDVTGRTVDEAASLVQAQNLTYRTVGDGDTVTAQLPAANAVVAAGSEVILYCGTQPSSGTTEMPELTGLTYEIARIRMGWSGLYINESGVLMDPSTATITRQSVEAGTELEYGSVVTVYLSDSSNLGHY